MVTILYYTILCHSLWLPKERCQHKKKIYSHCPDGGGGGGSMIYGVIKAEETQFMIAVRVVLNIMSSPVDSTALISLVLVNL